MISENGDQGSMLSGLDNVMRRVYDRDLNILDSICEWKTEECGSEKQDFDENNHDIQVCKEVFRADNEKGGFQSHKIMTVIVAQKTTSLGDVKQSNQSPTSFWVTKITMAKWRLKVGILR